MKRIVIVGATSGLGAGLARMYLHAGWRIGIAGRRTECLETLRAEAPDRIETAAIDIRTDDAPARLEALIERLGGMDVYIHVAGIGYQNSELDPEKELRTVETNATGFTRMTGAAFRYFARHGGHLAIISSIAGTKGLGAAPAYSATKRYQQTYIDALAQLARMQCLPVSFTDIRPGFVATDLLADDHYPMVMPADYAVRRIFRAIEHRRRTAIVDWRYAVLVFCWRLIPERLWERLPVRTRRTR